MDDSITELCVMQILTYVHISLARTRCHADERSSWGVDV